MLKLADIAQINKLIDELKRLNEDYAKLRKHYDKVFSYQADSYATVAFSREQEFMVQRGTALRLLTVMTEAQTARIDDIVRNLKDNFGVEYA